MEGGIEIGWVAGEGVSRIAGCVEDGGSGVER